MHSGAHPARTRSARLGQVVLAGLVVGLAIGNLYWSVTAWTQTDAGAYWNAAMRLRDGAELYPAIANPEASDVYRYAPWLAWAAIPFTYLPVHVAGAIWSGILVVASSVAIVPLARRGAWIQVAFFWPILIGISAVGNVQALVVASLVWGIEHRTGPLWIALAASLKAVPIVLALVYLARRQWWRAGLTAIFTAMLVAPMLLYDLSHYVTSAASAGLLITWIPLYAVVVLTGLVTTFLTAPGRWGWLSASATVVMALPRFFVYDVTFLMAASPARSDPAAADSPAAASSDTRRSASAIE